jgi:ribosomal protein S18 acetylase RimI-like enzyme
MTAVDLCPLDDAHAHAIASGQTAVYPAAMCESVATFSRVLASSDLSRGAFVHGSLVGWIVFDLRDPGTVYLHDIAVDPRHQGNGIARRLVTTAFSECRRRNLTIEYHARQVSYRLLGNRELMSSLGYAIVRDLEIREYYAKEFRTDALAGEHAHHIIVEPLTMLS